MNGKTGADAVSKAISHICRVFNRFQSKLSAVVVAAETAGAISSSEAAVANAFLLGITAACAVWQKIANFNSIQP